MSAPNRRPHRLQPGARVTRPGALVLLAVEDQTYRLNPFDLEHTLKRLCACYQRLPDKDHVYQPQYVETADPDAFWSWLDARTRARSRLLVLSTDPIKDLTLLDHVAHLTKRGYTFNHPVTTSRTVIAPYRRESRSLVFISQYNLLPEVPPEQPTPRKTVEVMRAFWLEYFALLDTLDLGPFHITIGSQTFATYRHRFIQHPVYIHAKPQVDKLERRATLGGCYQPCFVGPAPADDYYYLDTNSMYPWAMHDNPLPYSYTNMVGRLPLDTLAKKLEYCGVIATVKIRTDEAVYPCKHEGRLIFPVGTFTTTLTTPDLNHALARGRILECYLTAWYKQAVLFSDYVGFLWELRRHYKDEGNTLLSKLFKSWAVALYGKWGGHRWEVTDAGDWDLAPFDRGMYINADTGQHSRYTVLAGHMWTSTKGGLATHSFPAIMAHVAAYGRRRVFDLVELAGPRNTYFVVGDGVVVNHKGYNRLKSLIAPEELGALKVKHHARKLEIFSDTEFVMGDLVRRPGVKTGSAAVEDGVYLEHREPGLTTVLQDGNPARYVSRYREKRLLRDINTGAKTVSGWIAPLELGE